MKTYYVYVHTNKLNNKKYFGITCSKPELRWGNGRGYSKKQPIFYNAIQKYGWDAFTHEILFENLTKAEASKLEQYLIATYDTTNKAFGYNMTKGGEGHTLYATEEECAAARQASLSKYYAKIQQDPLKVEALRQYHQTYAHNQYKAIQENPELYAEHLKRARERINLRKQDPVERQKILDSKKRCKQKALQDPVKRERILKANQNSKQKVKYIRGLLFELYRQNPAVFSQDELEISFTKYSAESGCFKYNSAKQLQQILDSVRNKLQELKTDEKRDN